MKLFEDMGIDASYVIIGMLVVIVALIIVLILLYRTFSKFKKNYDIFMTGKDAMSLEDAMIDKFDEIDGIARMNKKNMAALKDINERFKFAFQKFAIVKYDAFKEMGGKLSFSLCMLTENNDGFVLTSMHSTSESCYVYIKEIIQGEAYILLSDEEKKVVNEAKTRRCSTDVEA